MSTNNSTISDCDKDSSNIEYLEGMSHISDKKMSKTKNIKLKQYQQVMCELYDQKNVIIVLNNKIGNQNKIESIFWFILRRNIDKKKIYHLGMIRINVSNVGV